MSPGRAGPGISSRAALCHDVEMLEVRTDIQHACTHAHARTNVHYEVPYQYQAKRPERPTSALSQAPHPCRAGVPSAGLSQPVATGSGPAVVIVINCGLALAETIVCWSRKQHLSRTVAMPGLDSL